MQFWGQVLKGKKKAHCLEKGENANMKDKTLEKTLEFPIGN